MRHRERGSRSIAEGSTSFSRLARLLVSIIASGLLMVAPYAAYSQALEATASDSGTIGPRHTSLTWTGPPKTTDVAGDAENNWDHFYLTVDSPGSFRVRISWA